MIQRFGGFLEAGWKLKQNAPELFGLDQRQNPGLEFFDFGGRPIPFFVRELLPGFDREFEILRGPFRPAFRGLRGARAVKGGVDLNSVEET